MEPKKIIMKFIPCFWGKLCYSLLESSGVFGDLFPSVTEKGEYNRLSCGTKKSSDSLSLEKLPATCACTKAESDPESWKLGWGGLSKRDLVFTRR